MTLSMKQDDPEKLGNTSAYEEATEMNRRIGRGDESKGDADLILEPAGCRHDFQTSAHLCNLQNKDRYIDFE